MSSFFLFFCLLRHIPKNVLSSEFESQGITEKLPKGSGNSSTMQNFNAIKKEKEKKKGLLFGHLLST